MFRIRSATVLMLVLGLLLLGQSLAQSQQTDVSKADGPVTARAVPLLDGVPRGVQFPVAVVLDVPAPFHINPDKPQISKGLDYLIPTTLTAEPVKGLRFGQVQFPPAKKVTVQYSGKPELAAAYQGRTVLFLPVVVDDDAPRREVLLKLALRFQACDEQSCLPPRMVELSIRLKETLPAFEKFPAPEDLELFKSFDPSVFAAMRNGQVAQPTATNASAAAPSSKPAAADPNAVTLDFFGHSIGLDAGSPVGLSLVMLAALVAGMLLNFTPCVLPVIPLKVLSLHRQAGSDGGRVRVLKLGLVFSAGIIGSFVVLGALVAGLVGGLQKLEWGQIFSYPAVSVVLGLIIIAMALGMFELYEIRLPQSVYMLSPSHDTLLGNALMGVLTAVLSTPCTGPMLGGTVAWAAKQPAWLSLLTFSVMGLGMALPYVVLMLNPKWVDRLPRSGPASVLVKQIMGLLLLAVAAFFLGPVIPGKNEWWLVAVMIVGAMGWMTWRAFVLTKRLPLRIATIVPALLLSIIAIYGAVLLTSAGPIPWQPFTPDALAQAQKQGRTILVEFTADWCGNCKALELTTYRDKKLASLFAEKDALALQVDLTSESNVQGWELQRKLGGGGGIPLAAVYLNGATEPSRVFQGLFGSDQLIAALQGETTSKPAR